MNRYWNLSEKERAALTREQVTAFLDVELMEKGVSKVVAPELEPIEDVKPRSKRIYGIQCKGDYSSPDVLEIAFETVEDAEAFIKLNPLLVKTSYPLDITEYRFMADIAVMPRDVPGAHDLSAIKGPLEKAKAAKDANAKRLREYDAAIKVANEATQGVWNDWHECREKQAHAAKVFRTLDEYTGLCAGNAELAKTFLAKVYDADAIKAAEDWQAA